MVPPWPPPPRSWLKCALGEVQRGLPHSPPLPRLVDWGSGGEEKEEEEGVYQGRRARPASGPRSAPWLGPWSVPQARPGVRAE